MNKSLFFSATSVITFCIVISNEESAIFDSCSNIFLGHPEIIYVNQDIDFHISPINELLIKDIDSEMEVLDKQTQEIFLVSAEQLKKLLVNESIKKTPDILMFNKGYAGLVWEAKGDESIFLYSIPDGTLFFNRVRVGFSETHTMSADKKQFSALIRKINAMV
jgi:hypothetical protein